ncbi:MAG: hypothetical protein WB986_03455 [Methanoregula sp.]|uniref:hypothetical protein n=1 Tax=Methanoregula sp. TaxID=2052170 RepID=UPI003BB158A2
MAMREQRRRKSTGFLFGELAGMLSASLENHYDFVLAWELRPGEVPEPGTEPVVHVMTGNLITPCRLNGLKGRVLVYEDEGARIRTIREKDIPDGL